MPSVPPGRQRADAQFDVVVAVAQLRQGHLPHGDAGRDRRAGNGGKHGAADDVGMGQSAGNAPEQHRQAAVKPLRQPGLQDYFAHKDKHGNRHQGKGIALVPEDVADGRQEHPAAAEHDSGDSDQPEGDGDGAAQSDEQPKPEPIKTEHPHPVHSATPFSPAGDRHRTTERTNWQRETRNSKAIPPTTAPCG